MSELPYNYYRITEGTETHKIAIECSQKIKAARKAKFQYLEETFGIDHCLTSRQSIEAIPTPTKEVDGLKPYKRRPGYFSPDRKKKAGREMAKQWASLDEPTFDPVIDHIGCARHSIVAGHLCRPCMMAVGDEFYFYEVCTQDRQGETYPDMVPVKLWEFERAIDAYNEALKENKPGESEAGVE